MFFFRKYRLFLKSLSIFLLIVFLNSIFFPTVSLALTAGPTAPEYSSFEPVDTSDMVDLASGDFNYNLPLFEVPGPEGGYPLSLSYHAGINPGLESSWVGLGWTLNAGAINRQVNGVPDDFNGVYKEVHSYWQGGATNSYSLGVGIGPASIGLSISHDTYRGLCGLGASFGVNLYGMNASLNLSNEGPTLSTGITIQPYRGTGVSISPTVSTNFKSVDYSTNIGLSVNGASVLGLNFSAKGDVTSVSARGSSIDLSTNKSGLLRHARAFFYAQIYIFTIGYKYHRYWSDEVDGVTNFGTLQYESSINSSAGNKSKDSYSIFDSDEPGGIYGEPDKQQGGSFPDFDVYSVTAQGLGGAIQPYFYKNVNVFRKNIYDEAESKSEVAYWQDQGAVGNVNFRFKNDFSNSFIIDPLTYPDFATLQNGTASIDADPYGFNASNNQLAGSKHIEWFTNQEIKDGTAYSKGLISHESNYSDRDLGKYDDSDPVNIADQIGGFMITNASGVTYHYSLPVYTYDEYTRSENQDNSIFRESRQLQPYAYTWLLTGITGPDYVDRGSSGFSEDDYGYWVKFDYGMWTDAYKWRNPGVDWHKDLDTEYKFHSSGYKELYYLDAISTRTHTALFVKSPKSDGKSVSDKYSGGYLPKAQTLSSTRPHPMPVGNYGRSLQNLSGDTHYYDFPVSTLKLDEIILLSNDELKTTLENELSSNTLDDLKANGNASIGSYYYGGLFEECIWNVHYPKDCYEVSIEKSVNIPEYLNNVLDGDDGEILQSIKEKSIRTIGFNTNYDLCGNTANSFDYAMNGKVPESGSLKGKLTLNSVSFKGKSEIKVIPDISFGYGSGVKNPDYDKDKVDIWGMFKSDYVDFGNENISRFVTNTSAMDVDAWSLREINTATGATIKINYESDSYGQVANYNTDLLQIYNLTPITNGTVKIQFYTLTPMPELFSVNSTVSFNAALGFPHMKKRVPPKPGVFTDETPTYILEYIKYDDQVVTSISANYIEINNQELFDKLNEIKPDDQIECDYIKIDRYDFLQPVVLGGDLGFENISGTNGGGLRVKSIELYSQEENTSYLTNYSYEENGVSTGVTSFEPFSYDRSIITFPQDNYFSSGLSQFYCDPDKFPKEVVEDAMNNRSHDKFFNLLVDARELPSPGVIYEKVFVQNSVKHADGTEVMIPGKKEYVFSVCDYSSTKPVFERESSYHPTDNRKKTVVLKNFTGRIGNLKSYTLYGDQGQVLEQINNTYLIDQADSNSNFVVQLNQRFNNQGRMDQLSNELKLIGENYKKSFVYSKKEEYPSILVKTETLHSNGLKETSENLAFDFYSGQVTKMLSSDSYGNYFLSESVPAYRISDYSEMGLKVHVLNYKHMLSQTAVNKTYKVASASDHTPVGLVSSSVKTWNKDVPVEGVGLQNIWRPKATYLYTGDLYTQTSNDGLLAYNTYVGDPFTSWTSHSQPSGSNWIKASETTLYDQFSSPLEEVDMNNLYVAVRKSPDMAFLTATVSPGRYYELAYTSAEFYSVGITEEGGVLLHEGVVSKEKAHTGACSIELGNTMSTCQFTVDAAVVEPGKQYRASVWVQASEASLSGIKLTCVQNGNEIYSTPEPELKAGNWYLVNLDFTPSTQDDIVFQVKNESGASIYVDDYRVAPLEAQVSSYVYNQYGELEAILDNENFYTRFEYDASGRLKKIYKELLQEKEKLVSATWQNYKVK